MTNLLDESIPVIAGSEINDDPSTRSRAYGRQTVEREGDETPIDWVERDARFVEKLATPDVTIADIIGDVDPIKAARGGHLLSDELTIHYGLLPRANRGIFAINELPDLAGKIQVGLFNIMQEGDVQIKGYPVRLPLDVMLVFSANPEDYTARGKIITPLKDRIGSEITTHYPADSSSASRSREQEAWVEREGVGARLARPRLHPRDWSSRSPSRRATISASTSARASRSACRSRSPSRSSRTPSGARSLTGEEEIVPRISDIYAAVPSMTGKMELEYEGEQVGAARSRSDLIKRAAGEIFEGYFVGIDFANAVRWFDEGNNLARRHGVRRRVRAPARSRARPHRHRPRPLRLQARRRRA